MCESSEACRAELRRRHVLTRERKKRTAGPAGLGDGAGENEGGAAAAASRQYEVCVTRPKTYDVAKNGPSAC